ncbi:MAG: hypothetical protein ABW276_00420 [Casimicrobiaceae bacterium]
MSRVHPCSLPADALLARYAGAGYVDCYTAEVRRDVSHAEYVEAFYTGSVFKLERLLLRLFLAKPSTDEEARQLAAGTLGEFSAWRVEGRAANQLLMRDIGGRTRSWFMSAREADGAATRLYFGSAVVPVRHPTTGKPNLGVVFNALLGFHKIYSSVLLGAARARLARSSARDA